MPVTKEDVVSVLGHDQYTVVGFDAPALPALNKRLVQAKSMGMNPKGVTVNDFEYLVIVLRPDEHGTGFDPKTLVNVVFKGRKSGVVSIFGDYVLDRWATAFDLAQTG